MCLSFQSVVFAAVTFNAWNPHAPMFMTENTPVGISKTQNPFFF
jgi:hypothetical protein